ncbi:hypothetical protein NQZ68_041889 [Dissostichus eleginoides]|nr:hypothetical protein NQZ68_041889 [Dissostichus eleginoides]
MVSPSDERRGGGGGLCPAWYWGKEGKDYKSVTLSEYYTVEVKAGGPYRQDHSSIYSEKKAIPERSLIK